MTHSLCLPWIFNDPLKHGRLLFLPFLPVLKLTRLSRMQSAVAAMSGDWCISPDFQAAPLFRQSATHQVGAASPWSIFTRFWTARARISRLLVYHLEGWLEATKLTIKLATNSRHRLQRPAPPPNENSHPGFVEFTPGDRQHPLGEIIFRRI